MSPGCDLHYIYHEFGLTCLGLHPTLQELHHQNDSVCFHCFPPGHQLDAHIHHLQPPSRLDSRFLLLCSIVSAAAQQVKTMWIRICHGWIVVLFWVRFAPFHLCSPLRRLYFAQLHLRPHSSRVCVGPPGCGVSSGSDGSTRGLFYTPLSGGECAIGYCVIPSS